MKLYRILLLLILSRKTSFTLSDNLMFNHFFGQTIVYFYDPIDVEQDQVIEGSVTLSQSKENKRFMNIHLEYSSAGRSFVKESVMR
jgi:hypothetical protein